MTEVKFLKKILDWIFCPIVSQNYKMLDLRICSKEFFQTLQHDKEQQQYKNHLIEVLLEIHL